MRRRNLKPPGHTLSDRFTTPSGAAGANCEPATDRAADSPRRWFLKRFRSIDRSMIFGVLFLLSLLRILNATGRPAPRTVPVAARPAVAANRLPRATGAETVPHDAARRRRARIHADASPDAPFPAEPHRPRAADRRAPVPAFAVGSRFGLQNFVRWVAPGLSVSPVRVRNPFGPPSPV